MSIEKYPDFVKSCGYGSVTGICGANIVLPAHILPVY